MNDALKNLKLARERVDEILAQGKPSLLSLRQAAYAQACFDLKQAERELRLLTDGALLGGDQVHSGRRQHRN